MRPIFIIYLVTGITLFFAILNFGAYISHAYVAHQAIAVLKPQGDDLAIVQAAQSRDLETASEGFALAVMQVVIIVSVRRIQKQTIRPDTAPEPTPAAF